MGVQGYGMPPGGVVRSVDAVVMKVIQQAKALNPKFRIATALRRQDVSAVLDKINQLDNFYASIRTDCVISGNVVVGLEFTLTYIDSYAILQVFRRQADIRRLTPKQRQIFTKAKSIITQIIKPDMTPYQRELAIHTYLVKTCVYDKEAFESGNQSDPRYAESYTPYGVLFVGRAVCDGIAQTATILLALAGITSYVLRSETHAWNLVKVGDSYYHLDVTWDITTDTMEFFNLTDEQISRYAKHNWRNKVLFPKATATKYNYFVVNNLVVHNMEELRQQIKMDLDAKKKKTHVWLSGFSVSANELNEYISGLNRSGYGISAVNCKLPMCVPDKYSTTLTVEYL